nr:putative transcription elongation factor SPT5 homolog 1 [Ipomoea batatas]
MLCPPSPSPTPPLQEGEATVGCPGRSSSPSLTPGLQVSSSRRRSLHYRSPPLLLHCSNASKLKSAVQSTLPSPSPSPTPALPDGEAPVGSPGLQVAVAIAVSHSRTPVDLPRDTWVRLKTGTYKGDLAKVADVDNVKQRVTVKLIPRIDLQALANKLDAQPRTVFALWKANMEEPNFNLPDPTVVI